MKSSNQNVASCPATGADHHRVPGDLVVSSNQYERGSALSLASSSRDSFKGMASCKLDLGPVSSAKVSLVSYEEQCINQCDNSAAIAQAPHRESDAFKTDRYSSVFAMVKLFIPTLSFAGEGIRKVLVLDDDMAFYRDLYPLYELVQTNPHQLSLIPGESRRTIPGRT